MHLKSSIPWLEFRGISSQFYFLLPAHSSAVPPAVVASNKNLNPELRLVSGFGKSSTVKIHLILQYFHLGQRSKYDQICPFHILQSICLPVIEGNTNLAQPCLFSFDYIQTFKIKTFKIKTFKIKTFKMILVKTFTVLPGLI